MYAARYFPKRYFPGRYFPPVAGEFSGWTETTSGGITLSGFAELSNLYAELASGGVSLGGEAAISHTYVEVSGGGVTLGGNAPSLWIPYGGSVIRRLWYRLGLGF